MLSRSLSRAAFRPACRPSTRATRASFNSFARQKSAEVPVISYEGGCRHEELLSAPTSNATGTVSPAGQDEQKKAYPLRQTAYEHLTPTLSRFTLQK